MFNILHLTSNQNEIFYLPPESVKAVMRFSNPALPSLTEAPTFVSCEATSMSIKWRAWTRHVGKSLTVIYRLQFNRHRYHGNGTKWMPGPDIIEPAMKDGFAFAQLNGLQHNTFYVVRVLPLLWHQAKLLRGTRSPVAGPFRTKCASRFQCCI